MSDARTTFIDLATTRRATVDQIDDSIDAWHADPAGVALHDYLGMKREEFGLWLSSPASLSVIVAQALGRRHAPGEKGAAEEVIDERRTEAARKVRTKPS